MKLVGLSYVNGRHDWVVKSDSSLLNNGKPLFAPEGDDLAYVRCVVLRLCRLGRGVSPKFACRYYDAWAVGLDVFRPALLEKLRQEKRAGTEALAFESSLVVGAWQPLDHMAQSMPAEWKKGVEQADLHQAVADLSELMTVRQGDLLFIDLKEQPNRLEHEDIVQVMNEQGNEVLYCKVK